MTEPLERDALIGLLKKLGGDEDEEVLTAARAVHARIAAAGMDWEDLLVPDREEADEEDTDEGEAEADREPEAEEEPDGEPDEPPGEQAKKNAESLKLIDKLLARSGISAELREELKGYKADIAEGEFTERDRRYLRALAERLVKRR